MVRYDISDLGVAGFSGSLDHLVDVYAAAMRAPGEQLAGRRAIMAGHAGYPGFRGRAAFSGDRLAGFGYGFHGMAGQWWHDHVVAGLKAENHRWMVNCFEVAELHVLPEYQGRGIGTALLVSLTGGRPEPVAVLSTRDSESPARRLYRQLGFTDLLTGFGFDGAEPPYAIMGAALPLRNLSPSSS